MKASANDDGRPMAVTFRYQTLMLLRLLMLSSLCCSTAYSSRQAVPLDKWKQLSNVKENKDFIKGYVDSKKPPGVNLSPKEAILFRNDTLSGFNNEGVDVIAGDVAGPAGCEPQERAVPIPPSSDPTVIHWPPCTKIPQCGGCCGTDILECTAIRSEPATFQVMKVVYSQSGSGNFEYVGLEDVILTKHLECDCRCRIQAHHCNAMKQDYNEQSCSCRCRNENEATSCPSQKRWDDKECACVCPRILNCLDDEFFSFSSCGCQRGTLGEQSTAPQLVGSDQCPGVVCKAGYRPVNTGTSCVCRLQTRSAGPRARSAIGNRDWSRGSRYDDITFD